MSCFVLKGTSTEAVIPFRRVIAVQRRGTLITYMLEGKEDITQDMSTEDDAELAMTKAVEAFSRL